MRFQGGWFWSLALGFLVSSFAQAGPLVHKLPGHVVPVVGHPGSQRSEAGQSADPYRGQAQAQESCRSRPSARASLHARGFALTESSSTPRNSRAVSARRRMRSIPVVQYLHDLGCTVPNLYSAYRLQVDAVCSQSTLEKAFGIKISHWVTPESRADPDDRYGSDGSRGAYHCGDSRADERFQDTRHYVKYDQTHGDPAHGKRSGRRPRARATSRRRMDSMNCCGERSRTDAWSFRAGWISPDGHCGVRSEFRNLRPSRSTNVLVDGFNGAQARTPPKSRSTSN